MKTKYYCSITLNVDGEKSDIKLEKLSIEEAHSALDKLIKDYNDVMRARIINAGSKIFVGKGDAENA